MNGPSGTSRRIGDCFSRRSCIGRISSWQGTLFTALAALGFLIAVQLQSEAPRVRYTTQERTPLLATARGSGKDQPVATGEMEAILGVLKGEQVQQADAKQKTDFSELTATFNIKNGVARNNDLAVKSPLLRVTDTRTHTIVREVGPFSHSIRPFTVNGQQTLCYVNVNELLGFEIGDLKTGKKLHRVEVQGFPKGAVKRHGCPSHGVGLTPDEREVWVVDAFNHRVHVFDNTVSPPKQVASIVVRDEPGWVTFSLDGRYAYPSTGDVIEVATRKTITQLADEKGGPVMSEKMVEIHFTDGQPVRTGDQFGLGRAR